MCPINQDCLQWVKMYMGCYCICSTREGLSLALGLLSVISWGVAEIPQVITNYNQKSAHGLSLAFLFTWIVGDFLNLFGCILEPATLPTQYYTAVLYLTTTSILTTQAVYFGHIYPRLKSNKARLEAGAVERKREQNYATDTEQVNNVERYGVTPSAPIPLPASSRNSSSREEMCIMSARSLVSHSPIAAGSFQAQRIPTSDIEQHWSREPLLDEVKFSRSAPPPKIKTLLCVVFLMTFFLGSFRQIAQNRENDLIFNRPAGGGIVLPVGRQLLEETRNSAAESIGIGSFFGWGMTVIYLGGRLSQICLNIRRGNVEGLNPLMFVLAIVGNATYVAR
ncbi:hypothetical protein ACJIZ3_025682 [Penstemon smallii]|uniref:Uncharacterized protein n=1 Tax=Penstemon smallii TaxID=265156 RepID=A0ABD3TWL5_9LAMI